MLLEIHLDEKILQQNYAGILTINMEKVKRIVYHEILSY